MSSIPAWAVNQDPKRDLERAKQCLRDAEKCSYAIQIIARIHERILVDEDCGIENESATNADRGGLVAACEQLAEKQASLLENIEKYLEGTS